MTTAERIDSLTAQAQALEDKITASRNRAIARQVRDLVSDGIIPESEYMSVLTRAFKQDDPDAFVAEQRMRPVAAGFGYSAISVGAESPLEAIAAERNPHKRYNEILNNWDALRFDAAARDTRGERCRFSSPHYKMPIAANTYSSTLVTAALAEGAITTLQNRLAALRGFTRDFGTDRLKPLASMVIRNVTGGPTVQTNPTNFASGDTVTAPISIVPAHYTAATHITPANANSGARIADSIDITLSALGDKIMDVALVPVTQAIFTATPVISSAPAFGDDDLKTLWGQLKKSSRRSITLDGEYFARFLPSDMFDFDINQPGKRGWDNFSLNTRWTGAGANTVGFACNPQAIACGAGLPIAPEREFAGALSETVIQIPGIDISVALYRWVSPDTRTSWASYELIFGAKEADVTAGVVIASA